MDNLDVLSDVFSTLRLRSDLYFQAELRGNFSVEIPSERRRIRFHLMRQGQCWLAVPGVPATALSEGDMAIVPNGSGQVLSGRPDAAPTSLARIVADGGLDNGVLRHGTGDRRTKLLCGFCQFDEDIDHPLLANLPPLIVLRPEDLGSAPWAIATLRLLSMEADLNDQGMTGILSRLLEIMFIQAVRRMTSGIDHNDNGYILALSDAHLSRALTAMHKEPQLAWTIQELAKLAGMSRARFADRFNAVVGIPPIRYLTRWRLMKARAMLANSDLDMDEIAGRCGYASVPSFTSRFKKTFSMGPGAYRRASRSI